jgi:hypothetical protein
VLSLLLESSDSTHQTMICSMRIYEHRVGTVNLWFKNGERHIAVFNSVPYRLTCHGRNEIQRFEEYYPFLKGMLVQGVNPSPATYNPFHREMGRLSIWTDWMRCKRSYE